MGQNQVPLIEPYPLFGGSFSTVYKILSLLPPAEQLGLWSPDSVSLSGDDLETLPPHQLTDSIAHCSLFYRVTPKHKVTIVKV